MTQARLNINMPACGGDGILKRTSKINVTAPYTMDVVLSAPRAVEDIAATVLEYVSSEDKVIYTARYDNSEANSFDYNADKVRFDGLMRLRENWDYALLEVETDKYWESEEIDFTAFADVDSWDIDTGNSVVNIKAVPPGQVIKANGDINLTGVGEIGSIDVACTTTGAGVANMAVSFDSGATYRAYSGGTWHTVDVNDPEDFKVNGMSAAIVSTLTNDQLSEVRQTSDKMRFAYFLERPSFEDEANFDELALTVSMAGYNQIADTSNYSYTYDPSTQTLTFDFYADGTYTITYADAS